MKQHGPTSDMIFPIASLIEHVSAIMTPEVCGVVGGHAVFWHFLIGGRCHPNWHAFGRGTCSSGRCYRMFLAWYKNQARTFRTEFWSRSETRRIYVPIGMNRTYIYLYTAKLSAFLLTDLANFRLICLLLKSDRSDISRSSGTGAPKSSENWGTRK